MDKNVLIPLSLVNQIIDLLCCWNILGYDESVQEDYNEVFDALSHKLQRVDLRESYSKVIYAKTEHDRFIARMEYLEQKRMLKNPF